MIVTSDISPEKNLYFLGGKILEELQSSDVGDTLKMFEKLRANYDIGFSLYMYSLDWLYILGVIELTENGDIVICT